MVSNSEQVDLATEPFSIGKYVCDGKSQSWVSQNPHKAFKGIFKSHVNLGQNDWAYNHNRLTYPGQSKLKVAYKVSFFDAARKLYPECDFILRTAYFAPWQMSSCYVSVSINGKKLRSSEEVPSEDKGRTTHETVISEKDVKAGPGQVELSFENGNGVLFLWYIEILVKPKRFPIFEGYIQLIKKLGEGFTAEVYLGRQIEDGQFVAIKIFEEEALKSGDHSKLDVCNEITILKNLKHQGVIEMLGHGDSGTIVLTSGREFKNVVYVMMEYAPNGTLYHLVDTMGAMGENAGRFFVSQLLDALEYMFQLRVVHRDLKPENVLVHEGLNLKIADFGCATQKEIDALDSFLGTLTYMAPEIKEGKTYKGTQVDMFSLGVILFIIVQGRFPFKEALQEDQHYSLILDGHYEEYFKKVGGNILSDNFKDLILKLFSFEGDNRPTIEQFRAHPWMNDPSYNMEHTREQLMEKLAEADGLSAAATNINSADSGVLTLHRQSCQTTR